MTRWLQAALSSPMPIVKTDVTDRTPFNGAPEQVSSVVSVSSVCQFAEPYHAPTDQPAPPTHVNSGNRSRHPDETTQPRASASLLRLDEPCPNEYGRCHTWTGRVVSLDEWRQLSAWGRYGPAGRLFCGICQAWVRREAKCGLAGCWKADGGSA